MSKKITNPENLLKNMDKFENGVSLLKEFYHVDTILRAKGLLWFCNEIKTINYEEEKISLNELSIQMKKYSKTFEKHSKNLDVEK